MIIIVVHCHFMNSHKDRFKINIETIQKIISRGLFQKEKSFLNFLFENNEQRRFDMFYLSW